MRFLQKLFGHRVAYAKHMNAIDEHWKQQLGVTEDANVFHELVSEIVHLDVFRYTAPEKRPWHFLVTCGMSAKPMPKAPSKDMRFAEVGIALPQDWPLNTEEWEDESNYWPIRALKIFGRLPFEANRPLVPGISIPSSHPEPLPYPGTQFYGAMLAEPVILPEEARVFRGDGFTVNLMMAVPITKSELEFKVSHGIHDLWNRMVESGRPMEDFLVVNPGRESVV
ncbi:MAG: suppressor of fused domain protein [Armatimonadetes bacterium]|nr:suppressor of fused domain protein [Armatimonadota bacterium]